MSGPDAFEPGEAIEFFSGVSWQRGVFVCVREDGDFDVRAASGTGPYNVAPANVRRPERPGIEARST